MSIEVRDNADKVLAQLRPGRPCRVMIDRVEMQIGGPPLVAQNGQDRWSGEASDNGTLLVRGRDRIARVFTAGDELSVQAPDGGLLVKITRSTNAARVSDGTGALLRQLSAHDATIVTDPPSASISGTSDLFIAGLLSAPELVPEIRALAACERILTQEKRP